MQSSFQSWSLDADPTKSGAPPAARRRLAVLLSGPKPPSWDTADRWLIQLRWVAIAGMIATTVASRKLVPDLRLGPLVLGIAAITVANLAWTYRVRRARPLDGGETSTREPAQELARAQLVGDVVANAWMLWFSGGLENPFAVFLAFHIALSGLLCPRRTTVLVGLLTLLAIGVLTDAEPLPLDSASLDGDRIRQLGDLVSLTSLTLFLGFFVVVYAHRLEELRQQSQRNERLAMLGRMVGGMSHELSTPLATILLASKDLVDVARETGSEDAARMAETVAGEARRASDIISLMRGQIRLDQRLEPLELTRFVRDLSKAELARLGYRGELAFDTPRPVQANVLKPALRQVLVNLLANAAEAIDDGAEQRIEVSVVERGDVCEIAVSDSGPGLSPEIAGRLGEPFQTTKMSQGGMGLGLYISSMMASRMNAVLRMESVETGGAKATLRLRLDGTTGPMDADLPPALKRAGAA
ncbi:MULTISPECIES: sensor histidine kinase [Sorangium]|uniref:histidine kinase n=1 Tax=Sorangium cellulosum TaxID=56 RepID=A0A4P2R1R5_SORCE|nr:MULTISPECIES: ATP-binding protein [Sorangium]AUX36870.1 histidine kinase [Sorangium cellulosum]WCQ96166.1 Sensor histidine kinase RegB [Sorangium sp. Soce836]